MFKTDIHIHDLKIERLIFKLKCHSVENTTLHIDFISTLKQKPISYYSSSHQHFQMSS